MSHRNCDCCFCAGRYYNFFTEEEVNHKDFASMKRWVEERTKRRYGMDIGRWDNYLERDEKLGCYRVTWFESSEMYEIYKAVKSGRVEEYKREYKEGYELARYRRE